MVVGPLAQDRLKALVAAGKLNRNDEVSLDRKRWVAADRLRPCLFPTRYAGRSPQRPPASRRDSFTQSLFSKDLKAPGPVPLFEVCLDGMHVVGCTTDGWIGVWEISGGTVTNSVRLPRVKPTALAISGDGTRVLIAARLGIGWLPFMGQNVIYLWDLRGKTTLRELAQTRGAVITLAFRADCNHVCFYERRGHVVCLDIKRSIESGFHARRAGVARFSPDGSMIATTSLGRIDCWQVATGQGRQAHKQTGLLRGLSRMPPVNDLAFSRDGLRFVTSSGCRKFNPHENDEMYGSVMAGPLGFLFGKAQKSIGDAKAEYKHQRTTTLYCWDALSGEPITDLQIVADRHTDGIITVDISPDGSRAITGSWDQTIRYWDMENERAICRVTTFEILATPDEINAPNWSRPFHKVAFSADGAQVLFIGGGRKRIEVWDLPHR